MKSENLKATLDLIAKGEERFDIFNLLPDEASGTEWVEEIKNCARNMQDYLTDGKEYDIDDLRDMNWQFAESQCEDYHNAINKRVQDLNLWAFDDLDFEVRELNEARGFLTMTELNTQYLYTAMRLLWDAVADQAFENTEEEEE